MSVSHGEPNNKAVVCVVKNSSEVTNILTGLGYLRKGRLYTVRVVFCSHG